MFANIWLGLRDDANTTVIEYLNWDEEADGPYDGPVDERAGRLFRFMSDQDNVQKTYKTPILGGNPWHIWTISISEPQYTGEQIKDEIDWLIAEHGTQVQMVGAWKWTGEQYGTEHVYTTTTEEQTWSVLNPDYQPDPELPDFDDRYVLRVTGDVEVTRITGMTGTPLYPIPYTQLLEFMPLDENGDPATVVTDRNLLFGQAPRSFFV